ncbi:MAG: hypothetical protein PHT00_04480 [Candidatus Methanomethylophilus sp.]|nr:hypothetical protein [Methanomethylophilus sp.]MDD3233407.1 hypothetical protein [Methanomethylophilus sp.]MDD4221899.1 hypothetical protein [Methanomethylophilus sp.]MDD4668753.1 hypothetical protein [Methanomethylophilus sp.]
MSASLRKVFSPAPVPKQKAASKNAAGASTTGTPAVTRRELDKNGFVIYNVSQDAASSIYVSKPTDRAYFEDEEEYAPVIEPIQEDLGQAPAAPQKAAPAAKEKPHQQPADIFVHAKTRPDYEPIDFDELVVIKKHEVRPKDSNTDEQPLPANLYVESDQAQSGSGSDSAVETVNPITSVRVTAPLATTSGAGTMPLLQLPMPPSAAEPVTGSEIVPAAAEVYVPSEAVTEAPSVFEVKDEVRDLMYIIVPAIVEDERVLFDDDTDNGDFPEDNLEAYDRKFKLRVSSVQ